VTAGTGGDAAHDFSLPDEHEVQVQILLGRGRVVLLFYREGMTP
jgi:peroxiredoxin